MSFTIICNNCSREFDSDICPDVVRCDSCKTEGCETCLTLTECERCSVGCCPDCLDVSGLCLDCLNEGKKE